MPGAEGIAVPEIGAFGGAPVHDWRGDWAVADLYVFLAESAYWGGAVFPLEGGSGEEVRTGWESAAVERALLEREG